MAKTILSQRSVYIAAAIGIVVTALGAVLFVPRLDMHPEAIKDGAADSSRMFFKFLLAAGVVLLACVSLSQLGGRIISGVITGLLYLAAGLRGDLDAGLCRGEFDRRNSGNQSRE